MSYEKEFYSSANIISNNSVFDIVHRPYPFHTILHLGHFGHALTLCHLFYQPRKQFFRLPVNIGKIAVQLAGGKQVVVQNTTMLFQIPLTPLFPYSNRLFFLGG